jgi:hypothetical protein
MMKNNYNFAINYLMFLANEALVPGTLNSWVAIMPRNLKNEAEGFLRELMMTGAAMKMQISNLVVRLKPSISQDIYRLQVILAWK